MTKQILFIHGAGDGAHAADAALVVSLRQHLGRDYEVHYPPMPNEDEPDYQTWKQLITEKVKAMGDDAILVGHSIGASVLIKMFTEQGPKPSVAGLVLIATPFWYDHDVWQWKDVELTPNASAIFPSGLPLFLYHGRADEVVPFAHVEMYASALPQAIVHPLDGRDHQINEDLSEVASDIRRLA